MKFNLVFMFQYCFRKNPSSGTYLEHIYFACAPLRYYLPRIKIYSSVPCTSVVCSVERLSIGTVLLAVGLKKNNSPRMGAPLYSHKVICACTRSGSSANWNDT